MFKLLYIALASGLVLMNSACSTVSVENQSANWAAVTTSIKTGSLGHSEGASGFDASVDHASRIFQSIGNMAAALTLSGPQLAACPSCHGLDQIAPNVFVETTIERTERDQILAGIQIARQRTTEFFGSLKSNPRIVVCRSERCAYPFGSKGTEGGISYGWMGILLRPSSIFATNATHELVHIELHWRMGINGWARGTVPVWFDEGLATVISQDPRFMLDASPVHVSQIMTVKSYLGDWPAHVQRVGWRTAYGAAATRIRQLERQIGRDGLKRFVKILLEQGKLPQLLKRAEAGERF